MRKFRVFPQNGAFRYVATIDGTDYLLRFKWLDRIGSWYLDFMEADGTEIFMGNRLAVEWPVLLTHRDSRKPAGILLLLDMDGEGFDMDSQLQLGDSHRLVFISYGEFPVVPDESGLTITGPL
jgi:hypothetical protein